ncbi:MAG: molybdopterin-dependent oxidoreductase, partial [Bacteroidetes bacterium]|nr:molybdopterin-dependent oxidoreductase [Bacteroidota bacterium]
MIVFTLNTKEIRYKGNKDLSLLKYLRDHEGLIAAKDGCSGQATCGACMVEINGKAKPACVTKMGTLKGACVITMEGLPEVIKQALGNAFVEKGGVQCGFCTPGIIMRTKILLQENPSPTREEIKKALNLNLCRCTGWVKVIDAIEYGAGLLRGKSSEKKELMPGVGEAYPKYNAYRTAIGERPFTDDLKFDGMLYSALKFSEHPRARICNIETTEASGLPGIIRIFTAKDIPGEQNIGLIEKDWPLMVGEGQVTRYIGDVIAGVVAESEDIARQAVKKITIEYEVLTPVTDIKEALTDKILVHENRSNTLEICKFSRGDVDEAIGNSAYISSGYYETQRVEHAFLEKESAVACPADNGGIELYSQGQGIYVDRDQVASILGLPEEKVRVILVPNGGGFGGKEDLTVQGHVALYAWHLNKPVRLTLSREESIRMHPKRHPVFMEITAGCDKIGKLTALKLRALGDTGAYASVGAKVMERVAGHCTGGYYFPVVDLEAKTIYTNNI